MCSVLGVCLNVCVYLPMRKDSKGLPWWFRCEQSAFNAGDLGLIPGLDLIPGLGRSMEKGMAYSTPVFWPGEFRGQKSLAGYNPWGCKESDITE